MTSTTGVWTLVACTGDDEHPGVRQDVYVEAASRPSSRGRRAERTLPGCRYGVKPTVTDEHRLFWLEPYVDENGVLVHSGFSPQEVHEMARALEALCPGDWRTGFIFAVPGRLEP